MSAPSFGAGFLQPEGVGQGVKAGESGVRWQVETSPRRIWSVGRRREAFEEDGRVIDGWESGDFVGDLFCAVSVLAVVE